MNARTKLWPLVVLCTVLLGGCEFFISSEARIERAEQAIAAGDMGAAIVDLKNVLQDDASNSTARLLLAQAQLAQGDVGAASADFAKVDAAQVPAEKYQPVLWQLRLAERRFDEVKKGLAADVPGLAPAERLSLLARAHLATEELEVARPLLEQAVAADPKHETARALLGSVIASGGDVPGAIANLEAASQELPESVAILRALGEVHARANDLRKAEAVLRRGFELADPKGELPAYLATASALGDVLLAQNKLPELDALVQSLQKAAPNSGVTLLLRGRAAAAKRDFPTAIENLQRLLNADPDNAQLRTMVAAVNLEQGSAEQAVMNLQRVLAANPDYVPARRLLAQAQIAQGRPADAAQTLAAAGPDAAPEVVLMQARAALAAGDSVQAVRLLERLESAGLPTEAARLDLAAAFLQAGRPERALKLLGESPESAGDQRERLRLAALAAQDRPKAIAGLRDYAARNADKPESVTFAALALSALNETAAATGLLEKLAAARPKDPDPLINLARVQGRAGQLEGAESSLRKALELKPSADVQVALAQLAAARGDEPGALRWLEQARTADPKASAPRALLARAYVAQRKFDEAQKVADELIALGGNRPEARILSAGIALQRQDTERALRDVNEAVKLSPDAAGAWVAKGEVHERAKQFEEARAAYRRALTLTPNSPVPPASLARLELAAGNTEAALQAARRAQQNADTRVAGYRIEADVLARTGRHADAARVLERAQQAQPTADGVVALYQARVRANGAAPERVLADWIAANPRDVGVRAVYAEHFQRAGDRQRAVQEYEAAAKVEPNAAVLLNNLAWLYQELGDDRALATARRAHELAPRNAAIADTLGWILVNQGQLDEGIKFLREAADGAPGSVDIQYHLAQALSRKGDKAAAKAVVDRVLQASTGPGATTPEWRSRFEELGRSLR